MNEHYLRRELQELLVADPTMIDSLESGGRSMTRPRIRMREKIVDLLELSRLGRSETVQEEVQLTGVVTSVLHEHRNLIEKQGIKVTVGDLPTVISDVRKQNRVFDNLVINAMKHAGRGSDLTIEIQPIDPSELESDEVGVRALDSGIGIDDSQAEKVFELFLRASTTTEGAGSALRWCVESWTSMVDAFRLSRAMKKARNSVSPSNNSARRLHQSVCRTG